MPGSNGVEAAAAANVAVEDVEVNHRGANYSATEDLLLCKAFMRASDDPIVGADQRTATFKSTFHAQYKRLVDICNGRTHSKYGHRTINSCFNRFKKVSRSVLKMIGCEASFGDPPSGDSDREEFDKRVREAFVQRNPDGKNLVGSIDMCKSFLEEFPKWRNFEEAETEERETGKKRKERPEGNKKAKEKEADENLVMKCLSVASGLTDCDADDDAAKKNRCMKKKEDFMDALGSALQVVMTGYKESNELKLLDGPFLSEEQKTASSNRIYNRAMGLDTSNNTSNEQSDTGGSGDGVQDLVIVGVSHEFAPI